MTTIIELLHKVRGLDCHFSIIQRDLGLKISLRKTLKNENVLVEEAYLPDLWPDTEKETVIINLFVRFSELELHYNQSSGQ